MYAKQRWVAILNPSQALLDETIWPLLAEAHDRLVRVRDRQATAAADGERQAAPDVPDGPRSSKLT